MATIYIPMEKQSSENLLDEWSSEVCAEGEGDPPRSFPPPEKESPVAGHEEDMEPTETGAQLTVKGHLIHSSHYVAGTPETGMNQTPEERLESNTVSENGPNQTECRDEVEDAFSSSSLRDFPSSKEGTAELAYLTIPDRMQGQSMLCVRELLPDAMKRQSMLCVRGVLLEDLTSSDSEGNQDWPSTATDTYPVEAVGELLRKGTENDRCNLGEEEKDILEFKKEDLDNNEFKQHEEKEEDEGDKVQKDIEVLDHNEFEQELLKVPKTSAEPIRPHQEMEGPDDIFIMTSPHLIDDGEEENEKLNVDNKPLDISSARRQWVMLDSSSNKPPRPTFSRSSSSSSMIDDPAQDAVTSPEHQGEQLLQNQPKDCPRAENQEATQQVFKQGCPSPAIVAMGPANQTKAGSQGSGCVVAERDKERRAGGRREGESRPTGGEKGQKDRVLNTGRAEEKKQKQGVAIEQRKEDKASCEAWFQPYKSSRMDTESYYDSENDSGVSADFSPGSTIELSSSNPDTAAPQAMETPIEREIRRAVQREQSLRRSRGLHNPPTNPEYVEIPLRKSIMSQPLPSKFDKNQGKDRQLAGKKMLKEINMETQREQVLVKLGKVRGVYDKGTVRQLKERQQLFEAFQEPKEYFSTLSPRSQAPSWASTSDLSTLELLGDDTASTLEGSFVDGTQRLDQFSQRQNPIPSQSPSPRPMVAGKGGSFYTPARGPGLSEGIGSQVIILENNLHLVTPASQPTKPTKPHSIAKPFPEAQALTVVDSGTLYLALPSVVGEPQENGKMSNGIEEEEELEEVIPKENPFFKLRSSTALDKVEQDIRVARERERELRMLRNSLYGGSAGGGEGVVGGRSTASGTQSVTPHQLNGLATPDHHVTPPRTGESGTPTGQQSLGRLGIWPPPPTEEGDVNQTSSPRTLRQRTPLLQRWESGQVNGHKEEED